MMKMNEKKKYQTCTWSNLVVAWWLGKNCLKLCRGEKGMVDRWDGRGMVDRLYGVRTNFLKKHC